MKKLFLLAACGLLLTDVANAQWAKAPLRNNNNAVLPASKAINLNHFAKTTSTVIATENFGTLTGNLPTGWTVSSGVNANWRWTKTASSSPYSIGALQSATAANGWMIYDVDSLTAAYPNAVLDGYLTSPSYDCSNYNNVGVTFQEYYINFQDSCYLDVSNNGGTSWTTFPINANNTLSPNEGTDNGYTATVNISSVAANQSNVKIRFHYMGRQGGGYSWLLDDVNIVDLDPVEVGVSKSCIIMPSGDGRYMSFGFIPKAFADTIYPITFVNNNGGQAQSNVNVNAQIFNGTTSVYNKSVVFNSLAKNAWDSLADFTTQQGLVTTATGNYTVAFDVNQTGDANTVNNFDTANFALTDTVWSQESGNYVYAFWSHYPSTSSNGVESNYIGTKFTMPAFKSDTLTSVSVGFYSATTAGVKASVQIYMFDAGNSQWTIVGTTVEKTLTAADISPSGQIRFANFPIDLAPQGGNPLVLGDVNSSSSITYAAVLQLNGAPASSTVRIWGTNAPAFQIVGGSGLRDTSMNDGGYTFAQNSLPFTLGNAAPAIRPNFGKYIPLGVNDVFAGESNVKAFPNPANNNITVSFALQQAADVNVKIVNTLGQTVATQQISKVGKGETRTATFSTSALAQGVYFYTVEANGARVTKRFVVAH